MRYSKLFNLVAIVAAIAVLVILGGCKHKDASKNAVVNTIIAKKQSLMTDLYFKTNIEPYKIVAVTSSVDGFITEKNFEYGQTVEKGRTLFVISSEKALQDYYGAIVSYIKARQDYLKSKVNFDGTKDLWKHKLVSYENYISDRDSLQVSRLSYLQARYKLAKFPNSSHYLSLKQLGEDQFDQLKSILSKKSQQITEKSPMRGIALFPSKGGDKDGKQLRVGSSVKKGQVLVSIGDLEGVTLSMKASEIHVNHIKIGSEVTITGPAFPNEVLRGVISMVGSQSESSGFGGGAAAEFPVKVLVKNLTDDQRSLIHVGMTANVKLELQGKPVILIPIAAVIQKGSDSYVRVQNAQTGKITMVPVVTGKTTLDKVAIEQGLNENDRVVVP